MISETADQTNSGLLSQFPLEIRRMIYTEANGGERLHIGTRRTLLKHFTIVCFDVEISSTEGSFLMLKSKCISQLS